MDLSIFLIQEAMTKDGFVIYKSFYAPIQSLSDESLGKLFRAIFEYQIHGVCVELPVELTMAFNFFKTKFESDNIKYEAIVERNKANGRKGGRPSKENDDNETVENPKNPMGFEEPKKADKDMDGDKDKEENGEHKEKKKERIDKSIPKKKAKFDVYADLSYVDAAYADIWKEWLEYKDAINKQYKAQQGAISQYKSLLKYADNNAILANAIVKRSIENSWQGLFELSDKEKAFYMSERSPYSTTTNTSTNTNTLPKGWTQERYDMYIRNGYTITEDGRLFKDGKEYK